MVYDILKQKPTHSIGYCCCLAVIAFVICVQRGALVTVVQVPTILVHQIDRVAVAHAPLRAEVAPASVRVDVGERER